MTRRARKASWKESGVPGLGPTLPGTAAVPGGALPGSGGPYTVLVKNEDCGLRAPESILPLLLTGCVALGRLPPLSGPQFPHLLNGASGSACLLGL